MTEALAAALTALVVAITVYLRDLHDRRVRQAGEKRTRASDVTDGQGSDGVKGG